jgi:PAS domain-containing protein
MHAQHPVEMILLRQLAGSLVVPMWIMDSKGNLVYYNEPAERLLGIQFDDGGPINADQLREMFRLTDLNGVPLPDDLFPIMTALEQRKPSHNAIRYCGLDEVWRDVEITATPVEGQGGRFLGIFVTFWVINE